MNPNPFYLNFDSRRLFETVNFERSCYDMDVYMCSAVSSYFTLCDRAWKEEFDWDLSIVLRCYARIWVSEGCSTDFFLELFDFVFTFNYFLFGLITPFLDFGWIFLTQSWGTCIEIARQLLFPNFPPLSWDSLELFFVNWLDNFSYLFWSVPFFQETKSKRAISAALPFYLWLLWLNDEIGTVRVG